MKKLTRTWILCSAIILFGITEFYGQEHKKEKMSVLYVGYDPDIAVDEKIANNPMTAAGMTPERFKEDLKTRYNSFGSYLKNYFTTVKTVDVRSYAMTMSSEYDVTIFDQTINEWKKEEIKVGTDGRKIYQAAKYLNEDFDYPTVFIGHTAAQMGRSIGLKMDWLCLCLDADAHHIKTEHAIFKGPFPVNITMINKPTPEEIYNYPSGDNVPKELPMWRVQKEGYVEGKGYRVGLVSSGDGFLDSPDAEYISSGVNTKDVDAVAIGRHGNFLMWGFSGSPDYMTDEAKEVFANAVVYIKQFKGQKPIARKYNDRIATKNTVDYMTAVLNEKSFAKHKEYLAGVNIKMQKTVKDLKAKKESGTVLSEMETAILGAQSRPIAIPTWTEYVKKNSGIFFKPEYAEHIDELIKFLKDNRKYMYSEPDAMHELKVDKDLQKIGIGNDDIKLLTYCVDQLNNGKDMELANKVLLRYTGLQKSPKDWKNWLNDNSSKLFFTQAGGYKWLIDTTK